jgi:hypothetical protein
VDKIKSVDNIEVLYGGEKYNTSPTLKVIGNDSIKLNANLKNYTVESVDVLYSPTNLEYPLEIIPINNSNGFDILNISQISTYVNRIELDINNFPLIYRDYNEPIVDFPFKVSDFILIENCKISESDMENYNSSDYDYTFFEVVNIDETLGYVDYSTEFLNVGFGSFGTYNSLNGYGTVANKNVIAKFKMNLKNNNYINGETVKILDEQNNIKFSGVLMSNDGWDSDRNKLRITKSVGSLDINDVILGTNSLLSGRILYFNSSSITSKLGNTRDKINYLNNNIEDLNSSLKRIQDSNYYQNFSYSIRSQTQYQTWKEPVKSIIHPSGFKEFSDLEIISKPNADGR